MWSSIEQVISAISDQVRQLQDAIQIEQHNMNQLDKAGIKYAGTWWKDGKYLYLIGSSDGFGYRKREYIGADPEKIKAAMESLKRGELFLKAKQNRDWNTARLAEIQQRLISTHGIGRLMVTAANLQDVPGVTNMDDQLQIALN